MHRVYKNKRWNAEKIAEFFGCSIETATFLFVRWRREKICPSDLFEFKGFHGRAKVCGDDRGNKFDFYKVAVIVGLTVNAARVRLHRFRDGKIGISELLAPHPGKMKTIRRDEPPEPLLEEAPMSGDPATWSDLSNTAKRNDEKYYGHIKPKPYERAKR